MVSTRPLNRSGVTCPPHVDDHHISHFLGIPVELRSEIYTFALISAVDTEEYVYFTATPPSKALLLTCSQLYHEAKKLYAQAYRRFWTESTFKIPRALVERSALIIEKLLREDDVARITKLVIEAD